MAGAKNHQYHILNPSVWPLIGSVSALVLFFGLVMWFHPEHFGPNGKWVFGAGIGVLVVVIRIWGGLPEGVMYAILFMNALTPFINRATQPRVFGTRVRSAA